MSASESTVIISDRFSQRRQASDGSREAEAGPTEQLTPGTQIGAYLVVSKLDNGGMGLVYKAHDTLLNRPVALKVLPPHLCENPAYVERFQNEARAQARLNSPFAVGIYGMLEVPAGLALVMEYLEGQTLSQRLRSYGALSTEEAVWLFDQILLGVDDIHRAGIVHRDLKPSNLFITHDHRVKIMDFGIAKVMEEPNPGGANALMGTLLYIAPEQINGRQVDYRADIYTLGISLFEAVTGELPFRRKTDYGLMHAHVQENPPRPRHYHRSMPRALEKVILKAIEKEPHKRFQSIAKFHGALMGLGSRQHVAELTGPAPLAPAPIYAARPSGYIQARRRWLRGTNIDLLLIAVLAAFVVALGFGPLDAWKKDAAAPIAAAATDKYSMLREAWGPTAQP